MPRPEVNRSGEMEAFVRVIERGGFSAAARELRMTPSAVSKLIARLEARLGARLLHRSTRKLQLTPEGDTFYERSVRVLADLADAENCASVHTAPRGPLRVNCSVPFGLHCLLPVLPEFLRRYPDVEVNVSATDRVIDLLDERADIAIRHGQLPASTLVARRLGDNRNLIVAAPAYLQRHGTPKTLAELRGHQRFGFNYAHSSETWPLRDGKAVVALAVNGNARVSDGESLRRLILAGAGIARMGSYLVGEDLAAGRLVALLERLNPGDTEQTHAVYLGRSAQLPARARVFLDYLGEAIRLDAAPRRRRKL